MLPNKTVVGLFKNMRDADHVAADLQNAGIPKRDIKVVDNFELEAQERGLESDIRQHSGGEMLALLKRLFGTEHHMDFEHPSALYTDWVRNGGILIAVNTDDIHAEQVSKIMETCSDTEMTGGMSKAGLADISTAMPRGLRGLKEEEETIPVFQEELHVGKRKVQRGSVRVLKHVTETPVEETINLRDETVTIERRPLDRIASETDLKAFGDIRVEMTETAEEPVVSKEVHVTEEITITKNVVDHEERIRDKVRKTDVDIEGMEPRRLRDVEFRKHFIGRFGRMKRNYSDYAPAYELGSALAGDDHFRNRDWTSIENEARRQWENKRPGSWRDFGDAIREGWETVRGRRAA